MYREHERKKKTEYGRRVREIEHGCFTPLVFTTSGGMAPEATVTMKRLASLVAKKKKETYSQVMGWIRCKNLVQSSAVIAALFERQQDKTTKR